VDRRLGRPPSAPAGNALTIVSKHRTRWDHRTRPFEDKKVKYNIVMKVLVAVFIGLGTGAKADDVMLDDGRRIAVDPEMVVVSNPDARAGLFISYGLDGPKTVESVGVNGCLSGHGMVAHGPPSDPSLRVEWVADGQKVFDFIGRLMCAQKTSGAKYLELLRQRQQLLPPSPSAPAKFKRM
jgi:hypothetical protein